MFVSTGKRGAYLFVRQGRGIIVLDEPGEFLAFFILCEGLRVDVSFLDEPCAEFGFFVVLASRWMEG